MFWMKTSWTVANHVLMQTWLRQRNMGSHRRGTLNGFAATMLLVHLLETRAVRLSVVYVDASKHIPLSYNLCARMMSGILISLCCL
jgi:DNA polymerase sigma